MIRFAVIALALAGAAPARPAADGIGVVAFKIARTLDISAAHSLGVVEAKRRVVARFAVLQQQFAGIVSESSIVWTGNDAAVRVLAYGQVATAAVAVREASVDIHVVLPTLLAPIAGNIEAYLGRTAADTLR